MAFRQAIRRVVRWADSFAAGSRLTFGGDAPGLSIIMMHGIYPDLTAVSDWCDPHHPLTLDDLGTFIADLSAHGYEFVSDHDIVEGLMHDKRYVWLTFDDGYANNLAILPILERHNAKATIFVSAGHVRDGRSFWWDVLWRECRARGMPVEAIRRHGEELKGRPWHAIENELIQLYGQGSDRPLSAWDRPMHIDELRELSSSPLISIGNHTVDHAILDVVPLDVALKQIAECQDLIAEWTGARPISIAYPNGRYDREIADGCLDLGLRLGVSTEVGRRAQLKSSMSNMSLPRISLVSDGTLDLQIKMIRAGFKFSRVFHRWRAGRHAEARTCESSDMLLSRSSQGASLHNS